MNTVVDIIHRKATTLSVAMKLWHNHHDWGCTNESGNCELTELHSFTNFMQLYKWQTIWCTGSHQHKCWRGLKCYRKSGETWTHSVCHNESRTRWGELPAAVHWTTKYNIFLVPQILTEERSSTFCAEFRYAFFLVFFSFLCEHTMMENVAVEGKRVVYRKGKFEGKIWGCCWEACWHNTTWRGAGFTSLSKGL